jgi:hypothetical protein
MIQLKSIRRDYSLLEVLYANIQIIHTQRNQLCLPQNLESFFVFVLVITLKESHQALEDVECLEYLRVAANLSGAISITDFQR